MRLLALLITGLIGYLKAPCHADAATPAVSAVTSVADWGRAA